MGILRKIAGLFVERVPVDEQGRPVKQVPGPKGGATPTPQPVQPARPGQPPQPMPGAHAPAQPAPRPTPGNPAPMPMPGAVAPQSSPPGAAMPAGAPGAPAAAPVSGTTAAPATPIAVALRAIVPQEYAAHLAPHGLHVIAAGPDITSEQARGWGAQVLVVTAECLGQDLHLLQRPQLATVYIAPQAVMLPPHPGVVQVQEPLHASDVALAAREAAAGWAAAGGPHTHG